MNSENKPPARSRVSRFRNWISFVGMVVALGALFSFLLLFVFNAISKFANPYVSILTYMVVPGFLIGGIVVMFVGAWVEHRRRARGGLPTSLKVDLNQARDRRVVLTFVSGSVVFLLLSAIGCYQAFNFTESVTFCGEVCHQVMKPERVAHEHGPHARVSCVECHVGNGVSWFVKSKISGSYQLYAVAFNKFPRPIPTPIKNLRPARETCEECHWPQSFVGNMDRTFDYFQSDASNSPYSIRLLLKIGGSDPRQGPVGGIHWHNLPGNKVEYVATDAARQVIPWVRVTDAQGNVTVFKTARFTNDVAKMEVRTMDCMDCHNRPAHNYLSPEQAVNRAMALNRIDASIPWIKTNAMFVLTRKYRTETEATNEIATLLTQKYPGDVRVQAAIPVVQQIYAWNFFPYMKSSWASYPNDVGHMIWPGCFRCHDGEHKTADKKRAILNDCNTCHTILAQGTGARLNELTPGGQKFEHPGGDLDGYNTCTDCHTGGP
ncbi:MAG TPA: NapC/NirT family cytochrome c [Candidatus Binatia bacterium]|nr:NapC/NirT family cytochrome c [Candidatus Binatia bacterium]